MKSRKSTQSYARLFLGVLVVAALATRVVPVISSGPIDRDRDLTLEVCERIRAAVQGFVRDTGRLPGQDRASDTALWLQGDGETPANTGEPASMDAARLRDFLDEGDERLCGPFWDGPYLMRLGPDPWGHAYVVTAPAAQGARASSTGARIPASRGWILSAGPDGVLQTGPAAPRPVGDDIGVSLR